MASRMLRTVWRPWRRRAYRAFYALPPAIRNPLRRALRGPQKSPEEIEAMRAERRAAKLAEREARLAEKEAARARKAPRLAEKQARAAEKLRKLEQRRQRAR